MTANTPEVSIPTYRSPSGVECLTLDGAAHRLGRSRSWVSDAIARGRLRSESVPRRLVPGLTRSGKPARLIPVADIATLEPKPEWPVCPRCRRRHTARPCHEFVALCRFCRGGHSSRMCPGFGRFDATFPGALCARSEDLPTVCPRLGCEGLCRPFGPGVVCLTCGRTWFAVEGLRLAVMRRDDQTVTHQPGARTW